MSNWTEYDGDEEDEEDEDNENDYKSAEDRIIFLIDARSDMFEKNNLGEVHFQNCVKVALAVMKSKIVASDKSSIGIIFFGTSKGNSSSSSPGVYSLFSLDAPSASRIRMLQGMLADSASIFHTTIGSAPSLTAGSPSYCPLFEAFWACSGAFSAKSQSHKQSDSRRIWLFTNDDDPNASKSDYQDRIIRASRDCSDSGIELSLWHMNSSKRPFKPERFYAKLLTVGGIDGDGAGNGDGMEDYIDNRMKGAGYDGFDMMMANVRRKEHRKRTLGHLILTLGVGNSAESEAGNVQIALQMFKTVSITVRPKYAWLFVGTNEPLKSNSRMYDGRTGATLDASKVETYLPINDFARIPFTAEELQSIKQSRGTGLTLLYFAPTSVLTPELNISSPYFIFPDERRVQGSTAMFAALITDLVKKKLVAIVQFVRTTAAMPRIAALIPQMETLSEDGVQLLPMGMNLVLLPFNEEITPKYCEVLSDEGYGAAPITGGEATDIAAVAMITAFTVDSVPFQTMSSTVLHSERTKMCYYRDISNPALQKFYSVLQAIALMESLPEGQEQEDHDLLKPYFSLEPDQVREEDQGGEVQSESFLALVRKRAVLKFKESVGLEDDAVARSEQVQPKKRSAAAASSGAAKKAKAVDGDITVWRELIITDKSSSHSPNRLLISPARLLPIICQLKGLSVAGLKEICQALGVAVSGVKKVLLERICDAVDKLS